MGQNRCGVEPGPPVAALALEIAKLPALEFAGIQAYNGWNQHIRDFHERKAAVDAVVEKTKLSLAALSDAGLRADVVTGGGTGTFLFEAGSGVFTEVQPGSYFGFDRDYNDNCDEQGGHRHLFSQALFVLTTVMSKSPRGWAVCDAGMKASSFDSGMPLIHEHPQLTYSNGGDEHGLIKPAADAAAAAAGEEALRGLSVGRVLRLVPGHIDPTVNMYDQFVCFRSGRVEACWDIARGPGL